MNFYQSIASNYDYIFPYNPKQLDFVKKVFSKHSVLNILDIGCATGNLAINLAPVFNSVCGIDLDPAMIKIATERNPTSNLSFRQINMLKINKYFTSAFDGILCFGNTLVHLSSAKEIELFLSQARQLLHSNGKLLLQIINYDRILSQGITSLPTIKNEHITFERNYEFLEKNKKLNFKTTLHLHKKNQIIENSIVLLPITKIEIDLMLKNTGFNTRKYYGDFSMGKLTSQSIPLIIEAF